jgi:hypothetical protein
MTTYKDIDLQQSFTWMCPECKYINTIYLFMLPNKNEKIYRNCSNANCNVNILISTPLTIVESQKDFDEYYGLKLDFIMSDIKLYIQQKANLIETRTSELEKNGEKYDELSSYIKEQLTSTIDAMKYFKNNDLSISFAEAEGIKRAYIELNDMVTRLDLEN